jgi:hypothetical protein
VCWMCDHPEAMFEDYVQEVLQPVIDRYGWAAQGVGGSGRPYMYTVGLTARGRPELVVTGRSFESAYDLLDAALATDEPRAGHRFDLLSGPMLQVLRVPRAHEHLAVATALYGEQVQALQLVWADGRGRWPWEAPRSRQTLLGRPDLPDELAG